jgi:hypothetical protein
MIILQYIKQWAVILTLGMVMAGIPLAARERTGATVEVSLIDGRMVKGELLAVKEDALLVYDQDAGSGERLDLQQVNQVMVLKKSKFGQGLLIGLGVALGIAIYNSCTGKTRGEHEEQGGVVITFLMMSPLTGLCGGILGSVADIDKKISLDGVSTQIRQKNLEKLKRYARERDVQNPAGPPQNRSS